MIQKQDNFAWGIPKYSCTRRFLFVEKPWKTGSWSNCKINNWDADGAWNMLCSLQVPAVSFGLLIVRLTTRSIRLTMFNDRGVIHFPDPSIIPVISIVVSSFIGSNEFFWHLRKDLVNGSPCKWKGRQRQDTYVVRVAYTDFVRGSPWSSWHTVLAFWTS